MANAIIIVVLVLICVFAVRSYCRKLKQGCCGGGGDQVRKTGPEDRDLSHYPYTYQIGIDGMTCRNCEARMENALNRQNGYFAEVSLKKKSAVLHTKQPVTRDDIRVLVAKTGYTLTSMSESGENG